MTNKNKILDGMTQKDLNAVEDNMKQRHLDPNNKTLKMVYREELHHFTKVMPCGFDEYIVCYVLKAERSNGSVYALGVYSKGEYREMNRHGEVHTIQTGERTWNMETSLQIN